MRRRIDETGSDDGNPVDALDRLIDAGLKDDAAGTQADDLVERVLAARRGGVGVDGSVRGRLQSIALIAAGILVVSALWFEFTRESEPERTDIEAEDRSDSQDAELLLRSVDELKEFLDRVERIELRDTTATFSIWLPDRNVIPDVPPVFADPDELEALKSGLAKARRRSSMAASMWPNSIRLFRADGRFAECSLLQGRDACVSFAVLGDCDVPSEVLSLFAGLLERATERARIGFGIVRDQEDLSSFASGKDAQALETLRVEGRDGISRPTFDLSVGIDLRAVHTVVFEDHAKNVSSVDLAPLRDWPNLRTVVIRQGTIAAEQIADLAAIPQLSSLLLLDCTVFESSYDKDTSCLHALTDANRLRRLELPGFYAQVGDFRKVDLAWLADVAAIQSLEMLDLSREDSGRHDIEQSVEDLRVASALRLAEIPGLRVLDLGSSSIPTGDLLVRLAERGRAIEELDLTGHGVAADVLRSLGSLPLRRLDLTNCSGVDRAVLDALSGVDSLKMLTIDRCEGLAGTDFVPLGRMSLDSLSVRQTALGDQAVLAWERAPSNGRYVFDFTEIGDDGIRRLVEKLRSSGEPEPEGGRSLSIVNCDRLTDESLRILTSKPLLFSEIDLGLCDGLTVEMINEIEFANPGLRVGW